MKNSKARTSALNEMLEVDEVFVRTPKKYRTKKVPLEEATQADRVIARFGNARGLARALYAIGTKVQPSTIYRWTYSKEEGGTNGLIPSRMLPLILSAARYEGITLTTDDLDPRPPSLRVKNTLNYRSTEPQRIRR